MGGKGGTQGGTGATSGSGTGGSSTGTGGSGCTTRELLTNGNFDAGDTGWDEGSSKWPALIVTSATAGVTAQSGDYLARLGGYAWADTDTGTEALDNLSLTVSVPASATNLVFSCYTIVTTEDTLPGLDDQMIVSIGSDNADYATFMYDNTTVHTTWQRDEATVDPLAAGETLSLYISASNGRSYPTTFLVDSVSLTATVCP
jgi:kumamolisin